MKQKTYYHIILDQSGSMQDCLHQTISGFNEQLQVIRSLQHRYPGQELLVGLTRFNDEVMHTYFGQEPSAVKELSPAIYQPGGTTALYDAIGTTVLRLKELAQAELAQDCAAVVVVILTDGYENASTLFSGKKIQDLISGLEATGKWTFSYLGATLDAVEVATRLNIRARNSMSFDKQQMKSTYCRLSTSLEHFMEDRNSGRISSDFLAGDQE